MSRLPTVLRPLFPVVKKITLLAPELILPIARRLPPFCRRGAPPRSAAASTAGYVASRPAGGVDYITLVPRIRVRRELPVGVPADHWAFRSAQCATISPAFVARIRNGRAVGHYGAIISEDDTLLFDLSPYFGAIRAEQHPVFLRFGLPAAQYVQGSVGVLTTRGIDNYYHFLLDVLPRLDLLHRSGLSVDRYLVNRHLPFQRELLERFGVPLDRIVQSRDCPHLRSAELVVPSLPDNEMQTPRWAVALLREHLLPQNLESPHRRFYVGRGTRRNSRIVKNERVLMEALRHHGVTPIDPGSMSVAEQVKVFAEAELVVAAHGAALANLAFCSPGATVVELFAPDYVNPCYWVLASQVEGLNYRYLIGEGRFRSPSRPMMGVSSDIFVDPTKLGHILDGC